MNHKIIDGMVTTATGRNIPAPNVIRITSSRVANSDIKKLGIWLVTEAIAEAVACHDEWNRFQFGLMNPKHLSICDRDTLNNYLFGETYPVFTL